LAAIKANEAGLMRDANMTGNYLLRLSRPGTASFAPFNIRFEWSFSCLIATFLHFERNRGEGHILSEAVLCYNDSGTVSWKK
jgi:hypothetical protein